MATRKKKTYCFFALYEKFIKDSKSGRRLQPNGKRLSLGTIGNYCCTKRLLEQFCQKKAFSLRIIPERMLTRRDAEVERNYWKKFYRRFTDYLYDDQGYYDNYVGSTIKNIKAFFHYLNRDLALGTGLYYKQFYVRKEEIAIFPLLPEELNFLIYDTAFEAKLTKRLQETKDVFVFGCTVALRVSDLLHLKRSALRVVNEQYYLSVRSQKTNTDTLIRLPHYAVSILAKYKENKKGLLPRFNAVNLNGYIKILLQEAGFTHPVGLYRQHRGKTMLLNGGTAPFLPWPALTPCAERPLQLCFVWACLSNSFEKLAAMRLVQRNFTGI